MRLKETEFLVISFNKINLSSRTQPQKNAINGYPYALRPSKNKVLKETSNGKISKQLGRRRWGVESAIQAF
jgi:DNA-binding CsgD family transcriptional regulator